MSRRQLHPRIEGAILANVWRRYARTTARLRRRQPVDHDARRADARRKLVVTVAAVVAALMPLALLSSCGAGEDEPSAVPGVDAPTLTGELTRYRRDEALRRLFEGETDALTVIKWKEVLDLLEDATDRCEDVANVFEGVVVKNG